MSPVKDMAVSAPKAMTAKPELEIHPVIANLKKGDIIMAAFGGDAHYAYPFKIKGIGKGPVFTADIIKMGNDNKPEKDTRKFKIDETKKWLDDTKRGQFNKYIVTRINGKQQRDLR
jgi:hypothetical protein